MGNHALDLLICNNNTLSTNGIPYFRVQEKHIAPTEQGFCARQIQNHTRIHS